MFEEEIKLLDEAYESYNLDDREEIQASVLNYIRERIVENLDLLDELISISGEEFTINDILSTFDSESNLKDIYKQEKNITKLDNNFAYGQYTTSCGNIVVECSDTLTVLRYFVKAIKSRNTITISDIDYNETNVKSALLVIFCEALAKFNIDRNLIMVVPFEECYYDKFDKIIYLDENKKPHAKPQTNKFYIYLEDKDFEDYVKKEEAVLKHFGKNYEILTGDFYTTISKINESIPNAAAIYTKNPETARKFINLVHCKNVFFNTSFVETEFVEQPDDILYMKKKIMYPLESANDSLNTEFDIPKKVETEFDISKKGEEEEEILEAKQPKKSQSRQDMQLIPKKINPWYKRIFECIRKFFKR